jgi:hypothetical protein
VEDKLELDSPLKYRSHGVYNVDEGMLYVITHNSLMSASTVGELYWPPIGWEIQSKLRFPFHFDKN